MTQTDPNKLYVDATNKISAEGEQPKPKNQNAHLILCSFLIIESPQFGGGI